MINKAKGILQSFYSLLGMNESYKNCFMREGKLTIDGQEVIKDLIKFCKVYDSTATKENGRIDPIAMGIAEGRRDVFNRIQSFLRLSEEEVFKIRTLKKIEELEHAIDNDSASGGYFE